MEGEIFVSQEFFEETPIKRKYLLQKTKDLTSKNKLVKVVPDRLVVYEKRGNYIYEAYGDPKLLSS